MLTETELKVLRLALDPEAIQGEWESAARRLFALLRKRSATAVDFGADFSTVALAAIIPQTQPDYGLTEMPYGKHKGELFKDISPWYLRGQLEWITDPIDPKQRWETLAEAIKAFLAQCG
jgi:hypothetical protein